MSGKYGRINIQNFLGVNDIKSTSTSWFSANIDFRSIPHKKLSHNFRKLGKYHTNCMDQFYRTLKVFFFS